MRARLIAFVAASLPGCSLILDTSGLIGVGSNDSVPGDASTADEGASDAALRNTDGAADTGAGDGSGDGSAGNRRVFVTDSIWTGGSIGGIAGADQKCAASASSLGGSWVAWLSTQSTAAKSRVTAPGPWYLVTGELAVTKLQLEDESVPSTGVSHAIQRDEAGRLVSDVNDVWTGTNANGNLSSDTCADWTSSSWSSDGIVGSSPSSSKAWTEASLAPCGEAHRLICFEL